MQKKKRKKKGLSMTYKKSNFSKSLNMLPSCFSDYTWIENTESNKVILEEERQK